MGRHKSKTRGSFSDKDTPLYLFGVDELLAAIENTDARIDRVMVEFITRQGQIFRNRLYEGMAPHTRKHDESERKNTIDYLDSWLTVGRKKTRFTYRVGFELPKEGETGDMKGLPALFLDIGTRPHYTSKDGKGKLSNVRKTLFVWRARQEAEKMMQREAPKIMNDILEGLKK